MNERSQEIMLDLLIKKAMEGLSEAEQNQLNELQGDAGHDDSFDATASAVALVDLKTEAMSANLRSRVAADAERYFDEAASSERPQIESAENVRPSMSPLFGWLGWATAAAAILLLFASFWLRPEPTTVAGLGQPTPSPALSIDDQRQRLLDTGTVNSNAQWTAGNVKEIVPSGDIIWSDETQTGYMTFNGLPVNDPAKQTYQLWIFDETQDPKTPIDGGTFDVGADGRVVIAINAKLRAKNPAMFAITIEKPGGVVVSDRKRIAALAKVSV